MYLFIHSFMQACLLINSLIFYRAIGRSRSAIGLEIAGSVTNATIRWHKWKKPEGDYTQTRPSKQADVWYQKLPTCAPRG